jgi:4-hydroxy-tetrahydrodipicolinate reductase
MKECAEFFLASENKLPALAVGSTGWSSNEKNIISKLAQRTSVLQTSNFSLGVATLNRILRDAAPLLRKLGYTPVLVEAHHCHKKDAPSGTALLLRDTIAAADGAEPCQTHSIRAGEVIGDHEVTYYGAADHLCFGHFAQDRGLFARGSIEVALWLAKMARAQSGQLSMDDFVKEMLK